MEASSHGLISAGNTKLPAFVPIAGETTDTDGITTVSFRDLRFFYNTPFFSGREKTPLSGTVYVNADRRVVRMEMNGRIQD